MSPASPTTTSIPPGGYPLQENQHLPLSPPRSPEDLVGLPAHQRYKIHHQIQQRASPTSSFEPSFPLASFFDESTYSSTSSNTAPLPPSTPETVRVKSEICSPPVSLRPSPSLPDNEDQTLQPSSTSAPPSRPFGASSHEISQDSVLNQIAESPSSPTARALRSLGLTRADLAQHAQRMKSFLGAGGRRGFPTAADLANVDVKSEATDSDMLLSLSSASVSVSQTKRCFGRLKPIASLEHKKTGFGCFIHVVCLYDHDGDGHVPSIFNLSNWTINQHIV